MDDLINRLVRWGADEGLQNHFIGSRSARRDCAEAAAALAEAQAEIARLREALRKLIAACDDDGLPLSAPGYEAFMDPIRAVLPPEPAAHSPESPRAGWYGCR